jgi:uncharacterized protein (TIGR00369 family)
LTELIDETTLFRAAIDRRETPLINVTDVDMANLGTDSFVREGEAGYAVVPSTDGPVFSDYIGPYYMREGQTELDDGRLHMAIRVQAKHLNSLSICHGGVIASFLDDLMGFAAYLHVSAPNVVTADLATRYISTAKLHDWVGGTAHILSSSRSAVHVEGRLHVGDRLIAFASGAWQRLTPRSEMVDQSAPKI